MSDRTFLKLGGALITDKDVRERPRTDVIRRLAAEIAEWPGTHQGQLIVGHGSGSFAHMAARETRFFEDPADPRRIAAVAASARRLNALVVDALVEAGVPAGAVPGSLLAVCRGGDIARIRHSLVSDLLASRLVPVLYGDAAPDSVHGGTIASTEALFASLATALPPRRIVLATDVDGVFGADPNAPVCGEPPERIDVITPDSAAKLAGVGGARAGRTDVTGGMAAKVDRMVELVRASPELEVRILSGQVPGAVLRALYDDAEAGGTVIRSA